MKINKSLDVDLNIISPQKHIRIHEGDVDSVDILIGVSVDEEDVDLDGLTIKYDATINNYLAEQDAVGSVVDNKISIPVTQNMAAMSGLLLIDVRMIQNNQILFTQTICATVEKAVVNEGTYIDFDKITIIQRMNALEEKMDYIETIVENFDTSKLIVSVNRPPKGAPAEVDVDLLRVGDTWIEQGENIVYKLVAAQYNYQPVPSIEPYHNYTWQPLNERHGVGDTDPPATETYQEVSYSVSDVSWTWLPVPKYFKGDHYSKHSDSKIEYYSCTSGTMDYSGVCAYLWHEDGASKEDLANKVSAITDQNKGSEILYPNVKAVVDYANGHFKKTFISSSLPPYFVQGAGSTNLEFGLGDKWMYQNTNTASDIKSRTYELVRIMRTGTYGVDKALTWKPVDSRIMYSDPFADYTKTTVNVKVGDNYVICPCLLEYGDGDFCKYNNTWYRIISSGEYTLSGVPSGYMRYTVEEIGAPAEPYFEITDDGNGTEVLQGPADLYCSAFEQKILLGLTRVKVKAPASTGYRTPYGEKCFYVEYWHDTEQYGSGTVSFTLVGGGKRYSATDLSYNDRVVLPLVDTFYTAAEIDAMIGDVETLLSQV